MLTQIRDLDRAFKKEVSEGIGLEEGKVGVFQVIKKICQRLEKIKS